MDLVQELLLTVLTAALLSFVVAKLVSVAAAKDVGSGDARSAVEEVKFGDRLRGPEFERAGRVQFAEEVTAVGKVDRFDGGKFEAEKDDGAGGEIGGESCDQVHEAPERVPEADGVQFVKEVKFEDRLRGPEFERAGRVRFVEEVTTVGTVDQFDGWKFVEEAEKDDGSGGEIGGESCDQVHEAPERVPEADGVQFVKEVKFEDRLRGPEFERAGRVRFVEEVTTTVGEVDQFDGAGEEIGVESCDQVPEAPERIPEAGFLEEVSVCRDSEIDRSDAPPMKSSVAGEALLDVSDKIQTEASAAPLEFTELPQESVVDIELNEQSAAEEEEEAGQSSGEEVKREDTEPKQSEAAAAFHEEMAVSDHIDDDDWEGIERSELEKDFAVAAEYCSSESVSDDLRMRLYGLHKVATEGPCYEPQPMALKVTARAKWNAWQRLGSMNPDVAMEQYITILSENIPHWKDGKSPVPTEADVPTSLSGLNINSFHQPNVAEDRIGASNANLVDNDGVIKDESLVFKFLHAEE